jgi:DNA-binding transcriptional MerR regulator
MALEENVLDQRQENYINWLCTPPSEREPASKEAYAALIGVNVSTLRRWEKKDIFRKAWQSRVDDLQGSPERSQRLLDTLYERAVNGDIKAAQLYLQATNRMAPQTVTVKSDKGSTELSDSELDELIGLMAQRERDTRVSHLKAM